jgi:integrase
MELYDSLRVTRVTKDRFCITLYFEGKKYRFYNGHSIGSASSPNRLPAKERKSSFESLLREFQRAISKGWTPNEVPEALAEVCHGDVLIDKALEHKLSKPYSLHYQRKMRWICGELKTYLRGKTLNASLASAFLNQVHWSSAMRNNLRSHFSSLESSLRVFGYIGTAKSKVKKERIAERLHRPFDDIAGILNELKLFDPRLHLCCLLAFGCLLRPHREIRLLRWEEISLDEKQIALAGDRTKGKKNRIIPLSNYIHEELLAWYAVRGENTFVFEQTGKPYGPDFFNGLWTKFRKHSKLLKPEQTIYSFRHSGAIRLFEKTGSLTKLQQVMGHSSLQVSLTYLRGLQIKQLLVEDMPDLG